MIEGFLVSSISLFNHLIMTWITSLVTYDAIFERHLENHHSFIPKIPFGNSIIRKGQLDILIHDEEQKRVAFGR